MPSRENCRIEITDPDEVFIFCSTFVETILEVSGTSSECWSGCYFESCTFKGKYHDRYFGDSSNQCKFKAGLRNCHFDKAILNLCSFLNCTQDDLHLPRWPHVTIYYPEKNASDFEDVAAMDAILAKMHGSMIYPTVVATTYHLPSYIRQSRRGILSSTANCRSRLQSAKSEPEPAEPAFALENIRKLLKTKPLRVHVNCWSRSYIPLLLWLSVSPYRK